MKTFIAVSAAVLAAWTAWAQPSPGGAGTGGPTNGLTLAQTVDVVKNVMLTNSAPVPNATTAVTAGSAPNGASLNVVANVVTNHGSATLTTILANNSVFSLQDSNGASRFGWSGGQTLIDDTNGVRIRITGAGDTKLYDSLGNIELTIDTNGVSGNGGGFTNIQNAASATRANLQSSAATAVLGIDGTGQFTATALSAFMLGAPNLVTTNTFTGANTFTNTANSFTGTFTGNASGLTGVNTNLIVNNYQYPVSMGTTNWYDATHYYLTNSTTGLYDYQDVTTDVLIRTNTQTHAFDTSGVGTISLSGSMQAASFFGNGGGLTFSNAPSGTIVSNLGVSASGQTVLGVPAIGVGGSYSNLVVTGSSFSGDGGGITNLNFTGSTNLVGTGGAYTLTGSMATIDSTVNLTLAAGNYLVGASAVYSSASAYAADIVQIQLYNSTDSALIGNCTYSGQTGTTLGYLTMNIPITFIHLSATKTILLQGYNIAANRGTLAAGVSVTVLKLP